MISMTEAGLMSQAAASGRIMTGVSSVSIPHIDSVGNLIVTEKYTEVDEKDARSTPERTVEMSGAVCQTSVTCCLHGPVGSIQKLVIARDYTKVTVNVNDEAAKRITDKNFTVDDAVKCISSLEWDGKEVLEKCLTAFTLKVEEKTSELLNAVLDTIWKEPKLKRLMSLVAELFKKFRAQLLSIRRGSLVFVLQHPSVKVATTVLDDQNVQSEIQCVLRCFFPDSSDFDWVADSAAWSVSSYTLTPSYQCQLRKHSESLCFSYIDQEDILTEKCMEYRIMTRLENMFTPLVQNMQSMMANIHRAASQQQQHSSHTGHWTVSASSRSEEDNISEDVSGDDNDGESVRRSTSQEDKTVSVQESGSDNVRRSILVPGASDHSSLISTEYGQRKIVQKDDESTESTFLAADIPKHSYFLSSKLADSSPEKVEETTFKGEQGQFAGKPIYQHLTSFQQNVHREQHVAIVASMREVQGKAGHAVGNDSYRPNQSHDDSTIRHKSSRTSREDKTVLVQDSDSDDFTRSTSDHSSLILTEYEQRKVVQKYDESTEHISSADDISKHSDISYSELAYSLQEMVEEKSFKDKQGQFAGKQRKDIHPCLKPFKQEQSDDTIVNPVTEFAGKPGHAVGNDSSKPGWLHDNPTIGHKSSRTDSGFTSATSTSDDVQRKREAAVPYMSTKKSHSQDTVDTAISTSKDIAGMTADHDKSEGSGSERDEHKTADTPPKKTKESKTQQAEHLLNWVNVKSKASQSADPEIQRMMAQVERALEDEDNPAPRAKALDTILVLDTSDSVVDTHLDQLKTVVHTFVDGIEEIVDTMNLEENLAVVQMGDRCWVRQHLTNDYARVRDVIDEMTADSSRMKTGGRTPIFQAMMVCLGAIEGRGGVVNVAGCHRVRPRIIFFTDGRPTDEATEKGSDQQTSVSEVKFALVQLISEFASKKHKTTPAPIFWVPVGKSPDHPFLKSLAALSGGNVVEPGRINELCRYYKVQETIGCVYKMVKKHGDDYQTEQQMKPIVDALAGNLEQPEKEYVIEEVRKKQKEPDSEPGEADDFDNVYEDKELVDAGKLPKLGTRVVRGQDWKWNNQDTEGPGTVIQHRNKRDNWLHVMWDKGTHNAYRYGDNGNFDVKITEDHPRRLSGSELIAIGVFVTRGEDWKDGDSDGAETGVVIRKRKDGKVQVRWENGHIGKYRFGADGKFEVKIVEVPAPVMHPPPQESHAGSAEGEELQGAVGGHDPAEGPTRLVWFWKDSQRMEWRMYNEETQDKLLESYRRRKDGTCIITRDGKNWRLLFKSRQAKLVDRNGMHEIKWEEMTEAKYRQGLETEFG